MFFEDISQIPEIAQRTTCAIFVIPSETKLALKNTVYLYPDEKKLNLITVEQIREFSALASHRETKEHYYIITPADTMSEAAQNAFLKTLEEPKPHCHFLLFTEKPSALLPTILSRAQLFYLRSTNILQKTPKANEKILALAKQLIAANSANLPAIATEIASIKPKPRETALAVTEAAIELLYKSYFKTGNPKFLAKLPNFIRLYDSISQNGHLKLHLVADLL